MAGSELRDSNINPSLHDQVRETGYTFNIIKSARLNADRMLRGEGPLTQFTGDPEPQVEAGGVKYKVVDVDHDFREANGNSLPD